MAAKSILSKHSRFEKVVGDEASLQAFIELFPQLASEALQIFTHSKQQAPSSTLDGSVASLPVGRNQDDFFVSPPESKIPFAF